MRAAIDKRQFGRRRVVWHGWVNVPGRDREPCVVRNFSLQGALLEFDRAPPLSNRFGLEIEAYGFDVECVARHRSAYGIGVYFVLPEEGLWPSDRLSPQQIVDIINRH